MRVLVLASKCLLDTRSGAAIELKTMLEALAAHGFDCHSISMTCFDGDESFPLARLLGGYADTRFTHYFLESPHYGVQHRLFRTRSTWPQDLARDEVVRYGRGVSKLLDRIAPDVVIMSGQDEVARALHGLCQTKGLRCFFYLANPGYTAADVFEPFERILCPTRALSDYYGERLGLRADVLGNVFQPGQFVAPQHRDRERARRCGFVTLVNPSPEKGGALFLALARLAMRERPDIRFAAVQARTSPSTWRARGQDPGDLANVYWLRNRRDLRPVLRRTAVLLFPSLWFEAAGRVPVEAQLSGIPVIASRRGGLPEQLNGGGFLIQPPRASLDDFLRVPSTEEVRPWLDRVTALLDDPHAYHEASARAVAAAAPFHPDKRLPALADEFARMIADA